MYTLLRLLEILIFRFYYRYNLAVVLNERIWRYGTYLYW